MREKEIERERERDEKRKRERKNREKERERSRERAPPTTMINPVLSELLWEIGGCGQFRRAQIWRLSFLENTNSVS